MSRRRKLLLGAGGSLLVLAVAVLILGSGGSWDTYPGPQRVTRATVARAPAWTRPCWAGRHIGKPVHVYECARLEGRVVWVINEEERHGGDAHIIVMESLRIRFAKMSLADRRRFGVPGIGHRVTFVGPVTKGKHVDRQLWAWTVEDHGI